jgi:hypothetical protein
VYQCMHDSGSEALQAEPGLISSAAIPFRFELSWHSLTQVDGSGAAITQSTETGESLAGSLLAGEWNQWERFLPSARRREILVPPVVEPTAPLLPGPSFATAADRGSLRNWTVMAALAVLLVTLVLGGARRREQAPPDETPAATINMGEAGWITEWVTDSIGSSHGRQLSLYRPSLAISDYRLVFSGRIERKSLGWVFRTADPKNYYVGKLQASKPGGRLTLIRYGVVRGVEDPHIEIALPQVSGAGALKVRLDAKRSRFTVYVQDQVVADWEDPRLKTGGVGFLSEREERGHVESVQISF